MSQRGEADHRAKRCGETEPDECPAHRRGALRGAGPQPRRGVQEGGPPDHHPRLPQGQGPTADHRPADRPRCRARRGGQRGRAGAVLQGRRGRGGHPFGSARDRGHGVRGSREADLHCGGGRQARDHPSRVRRSGGRGRRRRRDRGGRSGAAAGLARTLRHPHRGRPRGRQRRLRDHRPVGNPGRQADRGRPGDRDVLPGRQGQHARRPGRGTAGHDGRPEQDLRHEAGGRGAGRRGTSTSRSRSVRSRSRSCPTSTRTSPRPPASSTPSRS